MNRKKETKGAIPIQMTADDDLLPHYEIDYTRAKPNRFAGRKHIVIGPVPDDKDQAPSKNISRKQTDGSRPRKTVVAKRVYLYPSQVKILARIDKNFSAAVRKVIDTYKT